MAEVYFSEVYFLNDDKTYTPCDLFTWANQIEEQKHHVGNDEINGKRVSTVWLGLDHSHGGEIPLVFETMVFEGLNNFSEIYCERYSTWDEAEKGHQKAIEWVKENCPS